MPSMTWPSVWTTRLWGRSFSLRVAINYNSMRNGLAIILSLTIAYGQNIKKLMSRIRRDIQQEVEYTTGMSVEILKITVRSISQPED